ncbi:MAG: DUF5337 family protein [Pseudomonadota bacterium]
MDEREIARAKQGRLVMIVIIVSFTLWVGVSLLGGALGLPGRYAILADLAAMAAMAWALIVLVRLWRTRQD